MKTLAMGMLFAAALITVAGCHWHRRHWRDYSNHSRGTDERENRVAGGPGGATVAERDS